MSRHEPGQETDALVAERVMGWRVNRCDSHHWHTVGVPGVENPHYLVGRDCCADKYSGSWCPSMDVAAAMQIVEKLASEPRQIYATLTRKLSWETDNLVWEVKLRACREPWGDWQSESATLPHAICLAALQAAHTPTDSAPNDTREEP